MKGKEDKKKKRRKCVEKIEEVKRRDDTINGEKKIGEKWIENKIR